ncbi:MAG: mechanosensitive ion channel family protein [Planctomycetota bacterium]|jgi:MscS family membrane protein
MTMSVMAMLGQAEWSKTVNYEIYTGNTIWRFVLVLLVVVATMAAGRIVQFAISGYAGRLARKKGERPLSLLLKAIVKPLYVAIFAAGVYCAKIPLYFSDEDGISMAISAGWTKIAEVVAAIAIAYALYRLVDVIEYYLDHLVGKTETTLDDMLVPVVRKAMRITIAIIAAIFIVDNILEQDVQSILVGAGVGGVAIALAAKDTIANFFGSVTIFTDRPFQMGEMIKIGDHSGPVEEVGFRSTRVRTLQGHLVTIPNSAIVNTAVENIGRRPFIRRTSNLTITYDSGHAKTGRAVEIVKDVLAATPEINTDEDRPPRVYFSDFNDWSLNIYMSYWVKPPDYWLYQEVNERVNFEIMKRFEAENIEFAFPSQTLYMKKE